MNEGGKTMDTTKNTNYKDIPARRIYLVERMKNINTPLAYLWCNSMSHARHTLTMRNGIVA